MSERWVGVTVSSDKIVFVDAEVEADRPLVIQADESWKLQKGDRARAYTVMHQRVVDYLKDNKIAKVVVKASATSRSTTLAHLASAEVRGVVIAAAASVCEVELSAKSVISRTFGSRKVDEYVKDDGFWEENVSGADLRGGSREAAMLLLAARGE